MTSPAAVIHVAIQRTPDQSPEHPAPARVAAQRSSARAALRSAAQRAGCADSAFEKSSPRGRPVPTAGGWHWSISHDATFVAGTTSPLGPLGVDLERIALRRRLLVERVSEPHERALLGEDPEPLDAMGFARLWTAKEAVLKAEGIGLPGLGRCTVVGLEGPHTTHLTYDGLPRTVQHTRIEDHLVSLCAPAFSAAPRIVWHVAR